jgi:thioesterase domain-containing protein
MKEVQPHGPYNLIGMCEGALISFEITRMLRASGEEVAFLGMLDAWPIENTRRYLFTRLDSYRRRGRRWWRTIKSAAPSERAAVSARLFAEAVRGPVSRGRELFDKVRGGSGGTSAQGEAQRSDRPARFTDGYKRYYWPGPDFVPNTVDIMISVFRIRDQPIWRINDPACGWQTRTTAGVDIHTINCDHVSLVREPHVQTLAQMVAACLSKSAGSGTRS